MKKEVAPKAGKDLPKDLRGMLHVLLVHSLGGNIPVELIRVLVNGAFTMSYSLDDVGRFVLLLRHARLIRKWKKETETYTITRNGKMLLAELRLLDSL